MENHHPYIVRFGHPPDFLVNYRILTEAEGGRISPVYQGIRWDLWYKVSDIEGNYLFMVWPEFLDEKGDVVIQRHSPVPNIGMAQLWIINENMRYYHQQRIVEGMQGFACEGARRVAEYRVTKVVGLMDNPAPENMKD